MQRSDLKHSEKIVRLEFELTRKYRLEIFSEPHGSSIWLQNHEVSKIFAGKTLFECLRAAKADEPNKESTK